MTDNQSDNIRLLRSLRFTPISGELNHDFARRNAVESLQ